MKFLLDSVQRDESYRYFLSMGELNFGHTSKKALGSDQDYTVIRVISSVVRGAASRGQTRSDLREHCSLSCPASAPVDFGDAGNYLL
jgi:hypothetical protein